MEEKGQLTKADERKVQIRYLTKYSTRHLQDLAKYLTQYLRDLVKRLDLIEVVTFSFFNELDT
jgi:hypothetical protein